MLDSKLDWADGKRKLSWIIEEDVLKNVLKWPKIYDRAMSAIWLMNRNVDHWGIKNDGFKNDEKNERGQAALIRAGLAEFVSIEDLTKHYLSKKVWINNTTNPILHIVRGLRNVSFHVSGLNINKRNVHLYIQNKNGEVDYNSGSHEINEFIVIIDEKDFEEGLKDNNWKKRYSTEEKKIMFDTFNKVQNSIGFYELFRRSIEQYLKDVITSQAIKE